MPELPEVEVVRRGLEGHVVGRRLCRVELHGMRVARRHVPGAADLASRVEGTRVIEARRRGKYLWLTLSSEEALVIHLGMSGQMLVEPADAPLEKHCHAQFTLADPGTEDLAATAMQLRFVDQRTFGGLQLTDLVPDRHGPGVVPTVVAHIAPDPLEEAFDEAGVVAAVRRRHTQIKRALLDQTLISGIGNIYADEALWRARVHGERMTDRLRPATVREILADARTVMTEALGQGGTSFDALYVNVNGASGYFSRELDVYGREGEACHRCGTAIRREPFMNRSSYFCPRCQRRQRR